LRIALYLVLGWLIVAWGENVFDALGFPGTGYMISGGLAYTVGIAFYLWRSLPFNRAVWHLFVVAGSACFFVAIASYIFPAYAE
jgi:hemolysin III